MHSRSSSDPDTNPTYMFHYIRPPSSDCDGSKLFRALFGPGAENEARSTGAVVCDSNPSTGQVSLRLSMCEITSIVSIEWMFIGSYKSQTASVLL